MDNLKSFLKLKVIWKDDDMFELQVTASNGRFIGTTEVYDQSRPLYDFANSLIGFPRTSDSVFLHEAGEKDSYAYFAMKFYTIDNVGHLGVQVTLESNVSTKRRTEEKDKLSLEILTEPSLLDNFVKSLLILAKDEEGEAILEGVSA
jgi:hypothetical protein